MRLCRLRTGRFFFFPLINFPSVSLIRLRRQLANQIPAFVCLHQGCEASFPAAELLEVHGIIHAKETPNAIDDFPITTGHGSADRLHHGFGYPLPAIYSTPTCSLSGTVYDAPTGFCDPNHGWLNPFNSIGISGHGQIDPVRNMPSISLTAIGKGAFTQGFDPSGVASHGSYGHGHSQPTTAAPPSTHAVAETSNVANVTGTAQPGVTCVQCGTRVGRQSDLGRHMKKHRPDAQVFRCQVQGCQYSSKRKDKLMEHSRRPH